MKVICIQNYDSPICPSNQIDGYILPAIISGEIYHVVGDSNFNGRLFYELAERKDYYGVYKFWYESTLFIPCSNIDETELKKEVCHTITG